MSVPSDTSDEVRLAIPAHHEYGRIARIATAALALRLGFSYREVQDLRLAVDETLILLLGQDESWPAVEAKTNTDAGRVEIRFVVTHHKIQIRLAADFATHMTAESKERYAMFMADLVDEWYLSDDERSLRLHKVHDASGVD